LEAFWISLAVIFVAELGDKSQLMAMTFATRFKAWPVIAGITIATTAVHLVSVAVGGLIGDALPTTAISVVAGLAFLGFAAWTLRGDELTEEESSKAQRTTRNAIIAVTVAFFLSELGDKTMLATITLATQHGWLGTWIGSTGRRAGHRGGTAARQAPAGEGDPVRRGRRLRDLRHRPAGRCADLN
jgi:putative Ca2+/H+ antiporter (TMEM165/GDT1 family)